MPDRPTTDPELAAEQAYVTAAYARLEAMRAAAERVRAAYADVRAGGTHQARLERDIAWDVTQRRLADLDIGDAPLIFGRLDMAGPGITFDEHLQKWYVGRLAVEDEEHTPLVVDWRAPIAEPFYRATAIAPMGVVRRRHLITRKGREVIGLDDEVFDAQTIETEGLQVSGEGALLAALERNRTGRMGDIVATIQAEQDEAIRADLAGVLVVAGGPGTGKTAVALHRAAYLLYTHRRRLASQGVLLIGPSSVFLRYIEHVLPSLGEQDVQLATIAGLKPRLRTAGTDTPAIAALKGDARLARVIERALADRERALPRDLFVLIDGLRLRVSRTDSARIVESARRRPGTHNENRQYVLRRMLDLLIARYKSAAVRDFRDQRAEPDNVTNLFERDSIDQAIGGVLARGEAPPEGWEHELRSRLRVRPDVKEAFERMWPVLSGADLINDLLGFSALVHSAANGILSGPEQQMLHRRRDPDVAHAIWSEADVALIDEADALLGPVEAARTRPKKRRNGDGAIDTAASVIESLGLSGYADAASLASRYGEPSSNGHESVEPRTFGHVLVDEAQDLTAMQWRMLARRCPSGSMTLVGDPGQASRPGAVAAWHNVLSHLPTHNPPRTVTLTINYRTPAEVMDVAARLLAVAAPAVEPSQSVRATGEQPRFVPVESHDLVRRAADHARACLERTGTVAMIAPAALHEALVEALVDVGAVAGTADALDAPIAVLDPTSAKGLEFDHVVVVEPAALVTPDRAGLRLLYVTITRTTKSLVVVHAEALPEGLTP
ncbi:MAG TPA: UvrD-helicase domain-containing protein [Acidimicrobiia bacterium]|nr:UvrD-helicase domain-containing protein [Acidimicrobiia bacterium]